MSETSALVRKKGRRSPSTGRKGGAAIDLSQDLSIVGQLTTEELKAFKEMLGAVDFETRGDGSGFDYEYVNDGEREFAKRHRIPMDAIYKESDYALFVEPVEGFGRFHALLSKLVAHKELKPGTERDAFCFSGYYAAIHDDRHVPYQGQIMVIAENHGHRIYSEPLETYIAPCPGDIVVLNTKERHALVPQEGLSVEACQAHPLVFFALPFFKKGMLLD